MSTLFPGASDDASTLPNPAGTDKTNNPDHAALHGNTNDAVKAVEAKLGTGASTPASNTFLIGNGAGTSAWSSLTSAQLAARISDETGSGAAVFGTTPTLTTPKVDTINEATPGNGVSVDGVLLKDSKMNGSYVTDGSLTYAQMTAGFCVQQASSLYSAVATGTTTIPNDDTIPVNTEGDQYMTCTITPKSASNILEIVATADVSTTTTAFIIMALFQDSTSAALAVAPFAQTATATAAANIHLLHTMTAGTTSATTFKIRIGTSSAGTTTFNGQSAGRHFGAVPKSSMMIREYKA